MDKKSKNTLIISIIALAIVLIGVTYAYFSARITGLESASTISLTAGRMSIHYTEGNDEFIINNIYPREEAWAVKHFTLTGTNTTDKSMGYDMYLNVINNTFVGNQLTYSIHNDSSTNGTPMSNVSNAPISVTSGTLKIGTGNFTNANNDTQTYTLSIFFKDTGENQNINQEAVFNAGLIITKKTPVPEEVEIGDGGSTTDQSLPSSSYYNYSFSEQIYTPSEIGTAGNISQISFYNSGQTKTRTYDLYIVHTNKSSFENATDWILATASDIVFSGSVTMTSGEWTTITLDTAFAYNGTSNLVIITNDKTGSWNSGANFLVFSATGMAIYSKNDSSIHNPLNITANGTIGNVKNQIKITITPNE